MGESSNIPTCLITGASDGFGKAVALEVAKLGFHPVLIARRTRRLEKLDDQIQELTGMPATLIPMDLMDLTGIPEVVTALAERFGKIECAIFNAVSYGELKPAHQIPGKAMQEMMMVNSISPMTMLQAMHPLFVKAESAKIIPVTCAMDGPFWGGLNASKAAFAAFANIYGQENKALGIEVQAFDPGVMATKLRAKAFPGERKENNPTPASQAMRLIEECGLVHFLSQKPDRRQQA